MRITHTICYSTMFWNVLKWCTTVQSHWDGIRDKYEIWDPSTLTCSQKCGFWGFSRSRCYLSLQSSPPISFPNTFSFPHQTLSFSKNWELVGIWHMVFPLPPQLIYKLLLAPQVVVNQDMRALAAERLESKQLLLYFKYSVCFVFTLSAVIQWALRSAFQSDIKHSVNIKF